MQFLSQKRKTSPFLPNSSQYSQSAMMKKCHPHSWVQRLSSLYRVGSEKDTYAIPVPFSENGEKNLCCLYNIPGYT